MKFILTILLKGLVVVVGGGEHAFAPRHVQLGSGLGE